MLHYVPHSVLHAVLPQVIDIVALCVEELQVQPFLLVLK